MLLTLAPYTHCNFFICNSNCQLNDWIEFQNIRYTHEFDVIEYNFIADEKKQF